MTWGRNSPSGRAGRSRRRRVGLKESEEEREGATEKPVVWE